MKALKKHLLIVVLILSVLCNILLYYSLLQEKKPIPSITKFGFSEHDCFIYCEKTDDIQSVRLEADKNTFTIGDAKLMSTDEALYLINSEEKINLFDYEGSGFVINSNGELLYSLNAPEKKTIDVYITPSGQKYHKDQYCAGKTGLTISLETAELLREPCSLCV